MPNATILQRFPTEKYKRFRMPIKPLLTLSALLMLICLQWVNYYSVLESLILAGFVLPIIIWTPISSMLSSINNLANERKMTKAVVMIMTISLAAIIGGLLGFLGLSQSLFFMPIILDFLSASIFSPILLSICMLAGSLLAHTTHRSPREGAYTGFLVAFFAPVALSFLHIHIPLIIEVVCVCATGAAFITSIVAKQSLRAYYKYQYGHSNADGYQMDRTESEQNIFIAEQARKFNVSESAFKNLTNYCKVKIKDIKKAASFDQLPDHESPNQTTANSFKDIYHGLMNPQNSPEDTASVKDLLKDSTIASIRRIAVPNNPILELKDATKETLRSNLNLRTLYHQNIIRPGIEEVHIAPFKSDQQVQCA